MFNKENFMKKKIILFAVFLFAVLFTSFGCSEKDFEELEGYESVQYKKGSIEEQYRYSIYSFQHTEAVRIDSLEELNVMYPTSHKYKRKFFEENSLILIRFHFAHTPSKAEICGLAAGPDGLLHCVFLEESFNAKEPANKNNIYSIEVSKGVWDKYELSETIVIRRSVESGTCEGGFFSCSACHKACGYEVY